MHTNFLVQGVTGLDNLDQYSHYMLNIEDLAACGQFVPLVRFLSCQPNALQARIDRCVCLSVSSHDARVERSGAG